MSNGSKIAGLVSGKLGLGAAVAAFAALSEDDRTTLGAASMGEMGRLMAEVKGLGKQAKSLKDKVNANTIAAHAHNIAAIVALGLKDDQYGQPNHRNTTTGPAYMAQLAELGFSEAKAKLFWEYGQLALKEPTTEAGSLVGIEDTAKAGPKAILKFLEKIGVEKEADLKKIVQPVVTSVATMVDKLTAKLSDAEFETLCDDVREIRMERAEKDRAAAEAAKPQQQVAA